MDFVTDFSFHTRVLHLIVQVNVHPEGTYVSDACCCFASVHRTSEPTTRPAHTIENVSRGSCYGEFLSIATGTQIAAELNEMVR